MWRMYSNVTKSPHAASAPTSTLVCPATDGRKCEYHANGQSSTSQNTLPEVPNFYRRPLPDICISFGSQAGQALFKSAMKYEYMSIYFLLGPQLRTQDEPAYCGLASLVMVLNAFAVDPGVIWKGVWRWYHEEMLDCCANLSDVKKDGITIDQLTGAARCNQLDVTTFFVTDDASIEHFRELAKKSCQGDGTSIICSFSRSILGQSGTGHFCPIGGYHPVEDCVLLLETARFKYPPYWLPLKTLWKAMLSFDEATGTPRGYIVLTKSDRQPSLLVRISADYSIFSAARKHSNNFFPSIIEFLRTEYDVRKSLDDEMMVVVNQILQLSTVCDPSLACLLKFRSYGANFKNLSEEHREALVELILTIEKTRAFKMFSRQFPIKNNHPTSGAQRLFDPNEGLHLLRGWRTFDKLRCSACIDTIRQDDSIITHTAPYILTILLHILPALETSVLESGANKLSKTYLGAINYYIAKDMAVAAQAAGTYQSICSASELSFESATSDYDGIVFVSNSLLALNTIPIKISDVPLMKLTPDLRDLIGQQLFYNEVSQLQAQLSQLFNFQSKHG